MSETITTAGADVDSQPTIFAVPGEDGRLRGFVDLEWAPGMTVPAGAVPVTAEQRNAMLVPLTHWRLVPGEASFEQYELPPAVVPPKTRFTSLEFLARLTDAEKVSIVAAAGQAPALMLWLLQAMGAAFIDLADERTIAGIGAIRDAGLLSAERAAEILTA